MMILLRKVDITIPIKGAACPNILWKTVLTHFNQLSVGRNIFAVWQNVAGRQMIMNGFGNVQNCALLIILNLTGQVNFVVGVNAPRINNRYLLMLFSIINWTDILPVSRDITLFVSVLG